MDENTPPGVNIGEPFSATDADESEEEYGDTLTYNLTGDDAASFDLDASTGQLITKAALNVESGKSSYSVMVEVEDSTGNCISQAMTISVNNVMEPPAAPTKPTVVSGEER